LEEKAKQGNNRKRLLMWLISIWGVFAILNNFVSLRYKQTDQSLKKH